MSYDANQGNREPEKNVVLKNWKSSAVYLVLLGILCSFLSIFGVAVWLIIAVARVLYVRYKNRKTEASESAPEEAEKTCELCDIPTDTLIPVVTTVHGKTKTLHVCEECYHANVFRAPGEEDAPSKAENRKHLLHETPIGRDARIALLTKRRSSGKPLQEDLFLEDIEDAKTIRKICNIWNSYEFEEEYPEIDAILARLKKEENCGRLSLQDTIKLKEEFQALFHGEDFFTEPEETANSSDLPEQTTPQEEAESPVQFEQVEESEIQEPKELPGHLLYCQRCKLLYSGDRCTDCNKEDGRAPEPEDLCFLIDLYELQSNMLEDALRQKNIPFLKEQISGIGDVAREVRPMYGIFRFYTLYKHFADALTVLDNLPVSNEPEEE